MSGLRGREKRDGGFTVVELVVAMVILFVSLTAILGLLGASQTLSIHARERAVLTNAIAWYTDRVRAMPFDNVGIAGRDASGTIPPNETYSFNGVNVQFTVSMAPLTSDSYYYREMTIVATTTLRGRTFTTRQVVGMKNPNTSRTSASNVDPNAPSIHWDDSVTPLDGKVLYGGEVYANSYTEARFRTNASSPIDKITSVKFIYALGNGTLVQDLLLHAVGGPFAGDANWLIDPPQTSVTNQIVWDTTLVPDGIQTVSAICRDDQGRSTAITRRVIVDNRVPFSPGPPVGQARTDTQGGVLAWNGVLDDARADDPTQHANNLSYAYQYRWTLYKEPTSTVSGDPADVWSQVNTDVKVAGSSYLQAVNNQGPIAVNVPTEPFSRYWATLEAGSVRAGWNATKGRMGTPFISRPDVKTVDPYASRSTCYIGGSVVDYDTYLYIQDPNFPADSIARQIEYMDSSSATPTWYAFSGTVEATDLGTVTRLHFHLQRSKAGGNKPYYFRVGTTLRPTGWGGGTVLSSPIYSNAVGPTPQLSGTSANLLDKGWNY